MDEQEQKNHARVKLFLKVSGICLIVAGLALAITGAADFFGTMYSFDGVPDLFWCLMVGLPLLGLGGTLTALGFKKEIAGYIKNESVPVINELGKEIHPAVSAVASAVKDGLNEGGKTCACGAVNDRDSKFCKNCGRSLLTACPDCGNEIDADSKFCKNCGKKLSGGQNGD